MPPDSTEPLTTCQQTNTTNRQQTNTSIKTRSTSKFSSHYLPDISGTTRLIDIPFKKFGTLVGLSSSISFIPHRQIKNIRRIFNMYLQALLDDSQNLLLWKKYLLLPVVLFYARKTQPSHSTETNKRMKFLIQNNWTHFTLDVFRSRENAYPKINLPTVNKGTIQSTVQQSLETRAIKLIRQGEMRRAMQLLTQQQRKIIPSIQVLNELKAKHPLPGNACLTDEEIQYLNDDSAFTNNTTTNPFLISRMEVINFVRKARHGIKHGVDMLRYEHLHSLLGKNADFELDEVEFGDNLALLFTKIVNADIPAEVICVFQDNELCAVPKGDSSAVRPIGINGVMRKIPSALAFRSTNQFNINYFKNLQFAFDASGTEKIIHSFRTVTELKPTWDRFAMDGNNAFNSCNRKRALFEIKRHFSRLFPLLKAMYGESSTAWYYGLSDSIQGIDSVEGFQQGDVLAAWMYAMTIHPFLQGLCDILGTNGFVQFFVDDGNLAGDFEYLYAAIQYIIKEGSKFGYTINFRKGTYLLGKATSLTEANKRRQMLIALGFSDSIIVTHPHNTSEDPSLPDSTSQYGLSILGSYVGTDTFILAQLNLHIVKLNSVRDIILNLKDLQCASLIFRLCFCPKIIHLQRTIPASLLLIFNNYFDVLKKDITNYILGIPREILNNNVQLWTQLCLPVKLGGFGLSLTLSSSHAAYISSFLACLPTVQNLFLPKGFNLITAIKEHNLIHNDNNLLSCETYCRDLFESISFFTHIDANYNSNDILDIFEQFNSNTKSFQNQLYTLSVNNTLESFKNKLMENNDVNAIAWFNSISAPEAGLWLTTIPKSDKYIFTNDEFQISLRYRFYIHQTSNIIRPGTACDCSAHPVLDRFGHHLTTGCGKHGYRHKTHDFIGYEILNILKYSGIWCRREELNCLQTINDPDSQRRPDISVYGAPKHFDKKLIMDICITNPIPGSTKCQPSNLTIDEAANIGRAAQKSYNSKYSSYLNAIEQNNLDFLPVIFETSGLLHSESKNFFLSVAKFAESEKKIHYSILNAFFLKNLSIALQKYQASAILGHSSKLNGRTSWREDSSTLSYDFVSCHEKIQL